MIDTTAANGASPDGRAPVWLMGLTYAGWGIYNGVALITIPELLAARHVAESTIASLEAWTLLPAFFAFLLGPLFDMGFDRRKYAVFLLATAAACLMASFFCLESPLALTALLAAGGLTSTLYTNVLGGWLSEIISKDEEAILGAWAAGGLNGSSGVMAILGGELGRVLPIGGAALLLGCTCLLPMLVFPWMKPRSAPIPWSRTGFLTLGSDLKLLSRQPSLRLAIVFFAAPMATFSLTNYLPAHGADFHASDAFASRKRHPKAV